LRELAHLENKEFNDYLIAESFNKPAWRSEDKKTELIENAVKLSCDVLMQDYQVRSQNRDFVHRNWFREQDTPRRLKETIINSNYTALENIQKSFRN
jgi:hypothetical protein